MAARKPETHTQKAGSKASSASAAPAAPAASATPASSSDAAGSYNQAMEQSCVQIEKTLGGSPAFRKVDPGLYVVKQGSSYVMISVIQSGTRKDRALVRVTAQVVSGVRPEPSLFRQLLVLNGTLRFGAFAYVPEGEIVLFSHSLLGGSTLDANELVAAVHDVALVADGYDDRIVARYGGRRMQDVVEESALAHLLSSEDMPQLHPDEPADKDEPAKKAKAPDKAKAPEKAKAEPKGEKAPATKSKKKGG